MARLKAVFLIAGLVLSICSVVACTTPVTAAPDYTTEEYAFGDEEAVKEPPPVIPLPTRRPAPPLPGADGDFSLRDPDSEYGEPATKQPAKRAAVRNVEKPVVKDARPVRPAPVAKPDLSALKNVASAVDEAQPPREAARDGAIEPKVSLPHEAAMTGALSPREDTAVAVPQPRAGAEPDKPAKASTQKRKEKPESAGEKSTEQKRGVRTVGLPARKPPKPRPRPRTTSRKPPVTGGRRTREQQCAALRKCRGAFSKCRFSKNRSETDAEGWEIHKVKCGDEYSKCIKENFREGEMAFTRWFVPYDPCP